MNLLFLIPLPLRLLLLFALGTLVAGFINLAVYRLAWNQRTFSPWSTPPTGYTRHWTDRVPLTGWPNLRREWPIHGRGFWIRPLLVEVFTGLLFAGLYYWETERLVGFVMFPAGAAPPPFLNADLALVAHLRYLSHALLISLMLAASLIDIDEKTIPDGITIAGTLAGLAVAALCPWTLLPAMNWVVNGLPQIEFLTLVSPHPWPDELGGLPQTPALAFGLTCWTLWCGGLLPRRWNLRRGFGTGVRVFFHRLRVEPITYRILAIWSAGLIAISAAAWLAPAAHWAGLLTALVGVAGGGAMIWVVRIVGGVTLQREAMGFGDVTLMAMIGSFIGWQAALIVFFLAPFAGLVVGLVQWMLHRDNEIPYGPFLCLATFAVLLYWSDLWDRTSEIFALGWLLAALLAVCVGMMGVMLLIFRKLRQGS